MAADVKATGVEVARQEEGAPAKADSAPADLVRLAIEKQVDVEVIERLVALQERVTERNARAAYFRALSDFQDRCPPIQKKREAKIQTRKGGNYAYTYAPLEEIARVIRPLLREVGLSYSFDVAHSEAGVLDIACILRHVDGHEERSTFPVPIETTAAMSGAQKNGAALTYGRRQSLVAVLGLVTADADADAAEVDTGERITESDAADIDALIEEAGADRAKFLTWLGVESLADVPAKDAGRAVKALERKRGAP